MKFRAALVPAGLLAALACGQAQDSGEYAGILKFDTTSVRVHTARGVTRLHVELAVSPEQRTMGLTERTALADSAGMLFVYERDEPADAGFWMFRTRIPLDIAFIDSAGVVVATRRMEPCPSGLASGCPDYEPGVPYRFALEVNAGVLARHGIGPGARVVVPIFRKR